AHLARLLVRQSNLPFLLESYLAGLMHDIGKSAIAVRIKREDEIKIIREMSAAKEMAEAETIVLGFNHAQCGFRILKNMKLSLDILQAVLRHHDNMAPDFTDLGFLLAMANILSYFDDSENYDELDQILTAKFGIVSNDLPYLEAIYKELAIEMEAL
ncbi:MAG: HDOD domain-containing protein, partial [bacterium]|nr:HDOD domain-containing protein [bacterium]